MSFQNEIGYFESLWNGYKVLIYLFLLFFILHCLLIAVQKSIQGKIEKTNKSELWSLEPLEVRSFGFLRLFFPASLPAALCSAYSTHPKNCIIKTCLKIFSEIACALWGIHEKKRAQNLHAFSIVVLLGHRPYSKMNSWKKYISVLVVKI